MCLLQIFSPSLWFVFLLFWQDLLQSRSFDFNAVQIINYFFHQSCLWCWIQKAITVPKVIQAFSCYLLGVILLLYFTFRSRIHLELMSVKGAKSVSMFIFLACGCPVVRALFGVLFLLHCIALVPLPKGQLTLFVEVSFWLVYSVHCLLSSLSLIPHCFDYCSFRVSSEVRQHHSSAFALLLQYCAGYLGSSHVNFRIDLLTSITLVSGIFLGITLTLRASQETDTLTISGLLSTTMEYLSIFFQFFDYNH